MTGCLCVRGYVPVCLCVCVCVCVCSCVHVYKHAYGGHVACTLHIVVCPAEGCECMTLHVSFCRKLILPGALVWSLGLDTYFNLSPIYNFMLYKFVKISYLFRFCLQISYPAILFTMLMGFLNHGSFIFHALLPVTSKAFTLSIFLPGACIHALLPGTQRYIKPNKWG